MTERCPNCHGLGLAGDEMLACPVCGGKVWEPAAPAAPAQCNCKDDAWVKQKAIEEDGALILAGRLEPACKHCGRQRAEHHSDMGCIGTYFEPTREPAASAAPKELKQVLEYLVDDEGNPVKFREPAPPAPAAPGYAKDANVSALWADYEAAKARLARAKQELQRLQRELDSTVKALMFTQDRLNDEKQKLQTLREQQSKRMDILLDDNCIATIKRLTPTGGEEISFGGVMGGVRLLWNEAALGEKGSKS